MEEIIPDNADARIRLYNKERKLVDIVKILDTLLKDMGFERNFTSHTYKYSSVEADDVFGFQFLSRYGKFSFYYAPNHLNDNSDNLITNSILEIDNEVNYNDGWKYFKIDFDKIPSEESKLLQIAKNIIDLIKV